MTREGFPYEVVESNVPLEGIGETIEELVDLFGGTREGAPGDLIRFSLPSRRGIAAGDQIVCELTTELSDEEGGVVRLRSEIRSDRSPARVALLLIGVLGAMCWLLWPFFPNLGSVSVLGGIIAFAAYFLSLRRSPIGVMYDFVQRLAAAQRGREDAVTVDQ